MEKGSRSSETSLLRATEVGLVWLALFALVYVLGHEVGAWPKPPLGALRDLELYVGFLAGAAVFSLLLSRGRWPKADTGSRPATFG
jgi:hypothetical protein